MAYSRLLLKETNNSLTEKATDSEKPNLSVVNNEYKKFDTNYQSDKVKNLFNEYENINSYDNDLEDRTAVLENAVESEKLSFRAKLYLTSAIVVATLLVFLAIYNLFVINAYSSNISILQDNVAIEQANYNQVYATYSGLTDEELIKLELEERGYYQISENNIVSVDVGETARVVEPEGSTNLFDSICNFISGLFKG